MIDIHWQIKSKRTVISPAIEWANFYLQFQNMEEEKGEHLLEIMAELLTGALEIKKKYWKILMRYLVNTRYAAKHKQPTEVHVRFTKKAMKAEVLQIARDDPLKYKEEETCIEKSKRNKEKSVFNKTTNQAWSKLQVVDSRGNISDLDETKT